MKLCHPRSRIAMLALFIVAHRGITLGADTTAPPDAVQQQRRLDHLIEQLGSPQYAERRRAERQLTQLGFEAFDVLQAAEDHDDLEIATRARYLLRLISVEWSKRDDPPAVRSLLKQYASAPVGYREDLVERLARLPDDAGVEALCRIARFERSQAISKRAALMLISVEGTAADDRFDQLETIIGQSLGTSPRPAARWLRTFLRTHHDPRSATAEWDQLIETETQSPTGESFAEQDSLIASLLYTVGGLYLDLADRELGEQFARRAWQISPNNADHHSSVAKRLESQGRFDWAEREFRFVIDITDPDSNMRQIAAQNLAMMFHDQLRDHEAAIVWSEALNQRSEPKQVAQEALAYVEYFYSLHYAQENDRTRQQEHLERAVKLDPANADILIAMYHFPDADDDFQARTRQLIKQTAVKFENDIKSTPEPAFFNQWAWLISNTEGDFDKAIKYSQMSLKRSRQADQMARRVTGGTLQLDYQFNTRSEAGYLDTLAHCYHANGDFAKAVKTQQRAALLMPHSRIIGQKLAVFEKSLSDTQQAKE